MDPVHSFLSFVTTYKTLKKDEYVMKQDIIKCYQNKVAQDFHNMNNGVRSRIERFLKNKATYLEGTCEFVSVAYLAPILEEYSQLLGAHMEANPLIKNLEKKIEKFQNKIIKTTESSIFDLGTIADFYQSQPQTRKDSEIICDAMLESLQELFERHPEVFRPDNRPAKMVRMFVNDNGEKFVMVEEWEHALNNTPYSEFHQETWKTMDGKVALGIALSKRSEVTIEFLLTPIFDEDGNLNVLHTPHGTICQPASEVFFNYLDYLCFDVVPSDPTLGCSEKEDAVLDVIAEEFFPVSKEYLFFMEAHTVDNLYSVAKEYIEKFPKVKEGSLEYEEYLLQRKDRVELSQPMIEDVLKRNEVMAQFVHNQRACHRLNAKYCCAPFGEVERESSDVESSSASSTEEHLEDPVTSTESDEQVSNDLNKKRNKKRKEKAYKSKAAKVPEDLNSLLDVIFAPSKVPVKEAEVPEIPKKQKESSTCQKCFRTRNRCMEAKAELRESQNYAKRLEKELAEMKKKMETMEQNHAKQVEAQREALKVLKEENKQLKQKIITEKTAPVAVPVAIVAPIQKERSLEVKQKLIEFQDKLGEFRAFDPIGKAAQEIRKLTTLTKIQTVRDHCEYEMLVFKEKSKKYETALEENIELIQSNISTTISDLLPVPDYPVLPEVFYMELKKAQDQDRKNKELENECIICTEPMDKQTEDELFQCPECNKKVHLPCISQWFEKSNSCPCCRTQWT